MDTERARKLIEQVLTKNRFEHSLRVADTAVTLAKRYDAPVEKVELAALLHDYAKCMTQDELRNYIEKYDLPPTLLAYNSELWHGPVGAMMMKYRYGVKDKDVLNAIYYHTTGRANMSLIEQIIFVADFIEPGRNHPGVEEVRELAEMNLVLAIQRTLRNSIIYLVNKNVTLYPDTFYAYNNFTVKGEFD
ncbi:MAG TPA: bis(5'-nucleosyl)-tetraphosphatase (symmetrical) YqeK [Pseudogracilibacillus sp.]|nr:bis(5'-nucleosyl)-tetraphosphatase (symmetrical) YqeK [Pseudogracilibacillus sp.]